MHKPSYIESIRLRHAALKMEAQQVLNWDDYQFASYQEAQGYAYLRENFPDDPFAQELAKSKAFWSWWKMAWMRRDAEFLEIAGLLKQCELEEWYKNFHEPNGVGMRPHREIMESTYAQMVKRAIQERKEAACQ